MRDVVGGWHGRNSFVLAWVGCDECFCLVISLVGEVPTYFRRPCMQAVVDLFA